MADESNLLEKRVKRLEDELTSAKLSYTGLTYASLGAAVRNAQRDAYKANTTAIELDEEVEYLKDNINDLIDVECVDGLHYEDNMLFLTKGGEVTGDGVRIVGGGSGDNYPDGGGTSQGVVTITMLNESHIFSVAEGAAAELSFIYTSRFDPNGKGTCKIYKNNSGVPEKVFEVSAGKDTVVDIRDILSSGLNEISVVCTDKYRNESTIYYDITTIRLEIRPVFKNTGIITGESFIFAYDHIGDSDKTVIFELGTGTDSRVIKVDLEKNSERRQMQTLPTLSHGSHPLHVYMKADINGTTITSNHLYYELVFVSGEDDTPIVSAQCTVTTMTQDDSISIPYIVYDPTKDIKSISLIITYKENGETKTSTETRSVGSGINTWDVTSLPKGNVTLTISYTKNTVPYSKSFEITVESSGIVVSPSTTGLVLFLQSAGRSNDDSYRDVWKFNDINVVTFNNFNWISNGWMKDENGDICLRMNGKSNILINTVPFSSDSAIKTYGKTIELEFTIRDINDRSAEVIKCHDGKVGIIGTADNMYLQSYDEKVTCNYIDGKRIRVGFVIHPNTSDTSRFIQTYLNGVLSGCEYWDTTDSFSQSTNECITIGSTKCGIDLYSIRVYDRYLSSKEMLTNYIADIPNAVEKGQLHRINNTLYDSNDNLLYKEVKKHIPTVTFIGEMPTYKGDKRPYKDDSGKIIPETNVRMIFEHPTKPELNFDDIVKQIDVQGTSSAKYVRKNWKTKHKDEHSPIDGELPSKVFCLKVDYAEATGTHNTQNANLIETFYTSNIPPKNVPNGVDLSEYTLSSADEIEKVRTTIAGFPIVIFHVNTKDADIINNVTVSEIEAGKYTAIFSSKGNFNFDKGSEEVFAFCSDYDVECWEFLKNEDPQSFLTPWPDKPVLYWEPRYHKDADGLSDLLDEDLIDEATKYAEDNQMFKRFRKMYEWVHSTATGIYNGEPQATGETLPGGGCLINGKTYTEDTDQYRLAKFRSEFENYFDLNYCAIYYVYTFFALMVDQRAKNMFLTYWKNNAYSPKMEDESEEEYEARNPGKWYPYFYDNDTSYGISNKGHLSFDYYHQDNESINGTAIFNGANSVLWKNFREAFSDVIQNTYKSLRENSKITYEKIIDRFVTNGSKMWPAAVYNQDAKYKYIDVEEDVDDNGDTVAFPYLYQIRGNGEQHLEYFTKNRIKFCDSKWVCGDYLKNANSSLITIYNPTMSDEYAWCSSVDEIVPNFTASHLDFTSNLLTEEQIATLTEKFTAEQLEKIVNYIPSYRRIKASVNIRPPKLEINITPFTRMYYAVQFGAGSGSATSGLISKLAYDTSTPLQFVHNNASATDFETSIYGARDISSLGDLSYLYAKLIDVKNVVKLKKLIVGCREDGYYNPNLSSLEVGNNTLLEEVDISNCPELRGSLNLSACINLQKVYAKGTSLTSISLPNGGYLETIELPDTISTLSFIGQRFLTNDGIVLDNYANINKLAVDNCPNINPVELLNKCKSGEQYTVEYARLTDVDLGTVTVDFLINKLSTIRYIDSNNVVDRNKPIYIKGRCKVAELTGSQLADIKALYPNLEVEYDKLTIENIVFADSNGNILKTYSRTITDGDSESGLDMECPVTVLKDMQEPTMESTAQYDFKFSGWSKRPGGDADPSALLGITADIILYAAFTSTTRKYLVHFYDGNTEIKTIEVEYGSIPDPGYGDDEPIKVGTNNPELFEFIDWRPVLSPVDGETYYYAQFDVLEDSDSLRTITTNELEFDCDTSSKTAKITEFHYGNVIVDGKVSTAGRIADTYVIGGDTYTITAVEDMGGSSSTSWSGMELIALPETLLTIGEDAMSYSNIVAVHIPSKVSSIHNYAFRACPNLSEISVSDENTNYKADSNCLIDRRDNSVVTGCTNSIIPNYVTTIGPCSFWGRTELRTITISNSVVTIGSSAFTDCTNLNVINIPDSVQTFNGMSFYNTDIKELILPSSTKSIKSIIVKRCDNLNQIVLKSGTTTSIASDAFQLREKAEEDYREFILDISTYWSKSDAIRKGAPWGASKYGVTVEVRCTDGHLFYKDDNLVDEG